MKPDPADPHAAEPAPAPARSRGRLLPPLLSGLMLVAATGWGLTLPRAGDADPFHREVAAAVAAAPIDVAGYAGRDAEVAAAAVELLRPNVILSRSFTPAEGSDASTLPSPWVQLLVVQCRDARDILGHWPPVCYEANGYSPVSAEDTRWTVAGRELPGRRYRFAKEGPDGRRDRIVVANFLVLPDGRVVRDMAQVTDAGGDYRLRSYGAAQVQVLTPEGMSEELRRGLELDFLAAHAPLIETMASGVPAEPAGPADLD
ncbi:hypothetical protein [Phycisphaera mikurensis]|uniref:Methanolan biosynthesis EpsI domain-containing protein n=1 Tax=Phycisphaera mikurensis (strain NBRC 102666 / KCTC 22515 / FYK2301M01) TaxID=1142394 RepID=I0IDB1_PHYMF|nr:hypothetical protein [Phycisphaera mikurensis]MBB6442374.1 hypothetical protein [Phycisphaera mikurensis]BAM03249.1 hypothetical protein PSMK_10900 [Phycisphaera mikurensis NBRC 102666]